EQLQRILERYQTEVKSGLPAATGAAEHYAVPEATDPENLLSTARSQRRHQFHLWSSLLMHVAPPAIVAALVRIERLEANAALLVYSVGALFSVATHIMFSACLGVHGRRRQRARLAERFRRQGVSITDVSIAIGFSPGAVVRFYGSNYYNWDVGFLNLSPSTL